MEGRDRQKMMICGHRFKKSEKHTWTRETAMMFYDRTRALHLDYINRTDRLIKEKEREIEKINHELSVQSEKLQGQEGYSLILSNHKEEVQQKVESLQEKLKDLTEKLDGTEIDKEEIQQSYDDMAKVYNECIIEKRQAEANLRQCIRERDKARNDLAHQGHQVAVGRHYQVQPEG